MSKISNTLSRLVIIGDLRGCDLECIRFIQNAQQTPLKYEQVPFNTPLVVMFSSGTTGTPKGLYTHADNVRWIALLPDPMEFLKAVFATGVTGFGAGPRYFSELQKRNVEPSGQQNFTQSSPQVQVLSPSLARWIADAFGPACQISLSGGTELCGSFVHGTRSLPSYPGEIAVKALGMDVAAFSVDGQPLSDGESEQTRQETISQLVFRNLSSCMDTWRLYQSKNPNTKGIYVLGRSDGTLNPSSVRFGSSEIYDILSVHKLRSSILDSIVVGQQRTTAPYSDTTDRVLLFIKCHLSSSTSAIMPSKDLNTRIRDRIAHDLTPRHVPAHIFEVQEIPYNANGKKVEIQVKAVVNSGESARSRQRLTGQELGMLKQFEVFYHLEKLLKKVNGGRVAKL
ncbi:uncharacterized protein Z518_04743 [Rhinocladiella mackenziei CBS 650.93]|uniref:AMP-dependent synthetase/ligase domain-containing protein n=1 Tax=Rhinocladiella mackenziei CBS 650.93 TaxID=1442369 RepID=A0A0D2FWU8_9EURO|nr:uncharacterized protein Z518_04743 [Rhinocladiella mackenziei CBS 650.93]KIX06767.1 hypothetical protein Z518_04743 [Rhinocladiella mackenziei CBS 650.93]